MCTVAAEGIITEVVDQLVKADVLFTAFDVTKKVQAVLKDKSLPIERHRDLKRDIHNKCQPYVQQNLYEQQLIDVGAPTQAFLYFPVGADPSQYTPQPRKSKPQQPATPTPQAQPTAASQATPAPQPGPSISLADTDDGDEVDVGRKTDQRGSLTVPNFLLKAAGFDPTDIAYVTPLEADKSFAVSKKPVAGKSPLKTTYTVDHHTNVRVTASCLTTCGLTSQDTFDFERKDDQVVVTLHSNDQDD